jgi:hypothetical protein
LKTHQRQTQNFRDLVEPLAPVRSTVGARKHATEDESKAAHV